MSDGIRPFHAEGIVYFKAGEPIANNIPSDITVPQNTRLIIDHVSAEATLPTGQRLIAEIVTALDGSGGRTNAFHQLVPIPQGAFPFTDVHGNPISRDVLSFSQPIRMYGDPGTPIVFQARRSENAESGTVVFRISGHFVDVV